MSVVIHARFRSCFAVSFRHFEFCISSQSRQRSETIVHYKRTTFGSFEQRNLVSENGRKTEDTSYETEALHPVCSKDECSPLDIGIVYFI